MNPVDQIARYVEGVYDPGDWTELRCIRPADHKIERVWCLAEQLADQGDPLAALNAQGFNCYVGVNPRLGQGKTTDAGVALARTLFVDFDHLSDDPGVCFDDLACGIILQAGLPGPTLRVFSGHGIHAYWRLTESIAPDVWTAAQQRVILTLGSDPTIKNPERIMRLPGFDNVKDPAAPVPCFIIEADPSRLFDLAELLSHCNEMPTAPQKPAASDIQTAGPTPPVSEAMEVHGRALQYASRWEGVCQPGRHNTCFRHMEELWNDFGLSEAETLEILRQWNQLNKPPLEDGEIIRTLKDAMKYPKRPPGTKRTAGRSPSKPKRPATAPRTREPGEDPVQEAEPRSNLDLRVVDLDHVTERETEWLHKHYVPLGALTIIGGNPGSGKTSLALGYATCLSRGWPMPLAGEESARTGTTIIIGEEDSAARVLRGRLRKMGADLSKIKVFEGLRVEGTDEPFTLSRGLEPLDALMDKYPDAGLILFDPLTDSLGFEVNPNANAEVRHVLRPVNPWADRHNIAVIGITHLNKRKDDDAAFRLLGSMGFMAIARAVLGVAIHPEDADKPAWEKRRIVTPIKQSYAPEGDSLVFRLDRADQTLLWDPCPLTMGANEALAGGARGRPAGTTKAEAWLREQLDNAQGPVPFTTLRTRSDEQRICSERTLHRAADRIGVARATVGFGTERVVWWGRPGMNLDAWVKKEAV